MRSALCLVVCVCSAALAQESGQPLIVLTPLAGRTQFQVGERIPVQVQFQVRGEGTWEVMPTAAVRRVRPQRPDHFQATPKEGTADPLGDLFAEMEGTVGGFPRQPQRIDESHTFTYLRELNEFVVFRQPGKYSIRVSSEAVRKPGDSTPLKLESNSIDLEILPRDEEWAAGQLALAQRHPEDAGNIRTLRFLETEAAARVLAGLFGRNLPSDDEIRLALWASPHRELVRRELDRHMADADLGLSNIYVGTLIEFMMRANPNKPAASASQKYYEHALALAPSKVGPAAAVTWFTLLSNAPASLARRPAIRRGLVASLPEAPAAIWLTVLDPLWPRLAGKDLIPALQVAASKTWGEGLDVAAMARRRLQELDPKTAPEPPVSVKKPTLAEKFRDLESPDPGRQLQAAQALREGGAEAEGPLWQALERSGTNDSLRRVLVQALLNGRGWFMTPDRLERLESQCGSACRDVQRVAGGLQAPYRLTPFFSNGKTGFMLAHYQLPDLAALEEKLSQLPRGSEFFWNGYSRPEMEYVEKLRVQVARVLTAKGMALVDRSEVRLNAVQ